MASTTVSRGPVEVFFSYSHEDKRYLKKLMQNLSVLEDRKVVTNWHDRELLAGDDLKKIDAHLDSAALVALLISENFLSSPACKNEMARAFARYRAGQTSVVPIILTPCRWKEVRLYPDTQGEEIDLLGQKIVLPQDGKPIVKWRPQQDGYLDVVEGLEDKIRNLLDRSRRRRSKSVSPQSYFYNLRMPPTPFIGREQERKDLKFLLTSPEVQLVVVTGPGGVGKTRLALRVASDEDLRKVFPNGICLVGLEEIGQVDAVVPAIAKALDFKEGDDGTLEEALSDYLVNKSMLLLLDNFDQVAFAGEKIAKLLGNNPGLKVLITSRTTLNIIGEYNFLVPMLSVPKRQSGKSRMNDQEIASLSQYDAVKLFITTAKRKSPEFRVTNTNAPAVADICSKLEGWALAIDLAAARVTQFTPKRIRELLSLHFLETLDQGEKEQHKKIEATIAWSYTQLDDEEKKLFRRLAVFSGNYDAESVASVWDMPLRMQDAISSLENGLASLVAKNLLQQQVDDSGGEFRFSMLDIVREYALDRLKESGELEDGKRRHAGYFLRFVEDAEEQITSTKRGTWLKKLEMEHANLQAALEWCQSDKGDKQLGLRLAGSLFWFWNMRGLFLEGRQWLEKMLAWTTAEQRTPARAKALYGVGGLVFLQGDFEAALVELNESVGIWQELGDRRWLGYALVVLGMTHLSLNEDSFEEARRCEEMSIEIFRDLPDSFGHALALNDLGNVFRAEKDHAKAQELYRQSLKRWQGDSWGCPLTLSNIGFLEMIDGNRVAARKAFDEARKIQSREKDRWGMGETLKYMADLAVRDNEVTEAERLYRDSLLLNREIGRRPFLVGCLAGLAVLAVRSGREEHAARLIGVVDRQRGAIRASAKSIDHGMYDAILKPISERFSQFETVREEGREMDLMEAVSYALERIAA